MRVKVDSNGVVVEAGDHLDEPYTVFPVNWPEEAFLGLHVITGLSGLHLLVTDNQVIAREDSSKASLPGGSSPSAELVAAAVANWMAANPPLKGDKGESGAAGVAGPAGTQGDRGAPGAVGSTGSTGPAGPAGSTGNPGAVGPAGPSGASLTTVRTSYPQTVTLLLGIPQDVTFTWSSPFSDTSYNHDVAVAPALLGKTNMTIKSKTASALTITLTATLGVAGGVGAVAWA